MRVAEKLAWKWLIANVSEQSVRSNFKGEWVRSTGCSETLAIKLHTPVNNPK
jgi:hypothetical protein